MAGETPATTICPRSFLWVTFAMVVRASRPQGDDPGMRYAWSFSESTGDSTIENTRSIHSRLGFAYHCSWNDPGLCSSLRKWQDETENESTLYFTIDHRAGGGHCRLLVQRNSITANPTTDADFASN